MNFTHCPSCGSLRLKISSRPEDVDFAGSRVHVPAMQSTTCAACHYSFATPEQHKGNVAAARTAHLALRGAAKQAMGLLSGEQVRAMREDLGLSQKDAAEVFGGGPVAFSKYENESVTQSQAMDRLIRVIHHMGPFGLQTLREAMGEAHATRSEVAKSMRRREKAVVVATGTRRPARVASPMRAPQGPASRDRPRLE